MGLLHVLCWGGGPGRRAGSIDFTAAWEVLGDVWINDDFKLFKKKINHAAFQLVALTHTVLSLSSQKADPIKIKILMKVRES